MTTAVSAPTLVRCLYVSRRVDEATDPRHIDEILQASRARNAQCDITGGLIYTGEFFFQVLEGPAAATAQVMQSINADRRHSHVTPLIFETTKERRFDRWAMGYADLPSAVALIEPLFKAPDDEHAHHAMAVLLHALQQGVAQRHAF